MSTVIDKCYDIEQTWRSHMVIKPDENINPDHVFFAKRRIASYIAGLAQIKEKPASAPFFCKPGRIIQTDENFLDLTSIQLNDAELIEVLPEIAKLPLITNLNLHRNRITGASIVKILEFLPHLQKLNISNCGLNLNDGFIHFAQFKQLRDLCIASNGLKSAQLDQLRKSDSLIRVDFSENTNLDIVSKGRLYAALAYNEQLLLKQSVGSKLPDPETIQQEKANFVLLNFEKYRRKVQENEKLNADIKAFCSRPTPPFKF